MPRRSRIVIPETPHHVTQRGCRRQVVFFSDQDREIYLNLLNTHAKECGLEILAFCLMTNHIHLLAVPREQDSLRRTLQIAHKRYAQYINTQKKLTGHLWQERFYSSTVDDEYFWVALRYITRNPVVARMAQHPIEYNWSSARSHCGMEESAILTKDEK